MERIAFGELIYGAEKSEQREAVMRQLEELASPLRVLPLPADAGRSYSALRAELEAGGRVIGNNDLWIAAHAKAAKLVLVTNNEREFQRVSGLEVQIRCALEGAGVEFIDENGGGSGVRLRKSSKEKQGSDPRNSPLDY